MKIAVAMSGGIDSSIAAIMLKEQGHEVIGITGNFNTGFPEGKISGLNSAEASRKSALIADMFSFKHYTFDIEDDFFKTIVSPFCTDYLNGRTPNPCIFCNPLIKFKSLLAAANSYGCEKLATGHYSFIRLDETSGRYYISRGVDPAKDQSYFLYRLEQDTLRNITFPLGGYLKSEVKAKAMKLMLPSAEDEESQEICFVPEDAYPAFIENMSGNTPEPGNIVDTSGKVLGTHRGIHHYTIGQRRGLGIAAPRPLYVKSINVADNTITAGYIEEIMRQRLTASDIVHMKTENLTHSGVYVKTRSVQKPVAADTIEADGVLKVTLKEGMAGITPGQSCVIYDAEGCVLGGGIISDQEHFE